MTEHAGKVTFNGSPLTLLGDGPTLGEQAPDVSLLANDLTEVRLCEFRGDVVVVCSVPSLDTPVCDTEVRRFNQAAAGLGRDVTILTVSMDLPFAQSRWCGAAGIEAVRTLSDHRSAAFGLAYGVLIKELRLLARAVFVLDRQGAVRYIELVREMTNEPDYDAALQAANELTSGQA